ncbi:MAG: hypothetical protein VX589_02005 [Myxococcota bacterium]|nr:hypothetical protein [Myxococcota bacterium]
MSSSKTRFDWIWLASLGWFLASTAVAQSQTIRTGPVGDGGTLGILIDNPNVSSSTFRLGPPSGGGLEFTVERVEQAKLTVQCLKDARSKLPALELAGTHVPRKIDPFSVAFADGPPVIWMTSARRGRAALRQLIRQTSPNVEVLLRRPAEMPNEFAALRFSPLIILNLIDWPRLNVQQQRAILNAVGAGTHLLVTAGEGGQLDKTLSEILRTRIKVGEAPEFELTRHLPRASSRRLLDLGKGIQPLVESAAGTLMAAVQYGLGEIRLLGLSVRDLDVSVITAAAFRMPTDPLAPILAWLDQSEEVSQGKTYVLGGHIWCLLLGLFLGLFVLRRHRRASLTFVLIWCGAAIFFPPTFAATHVAESRAVGIAVAERTLVVGTARLDQATAGLRTVDAGIHPLSLEMTRGGSVCVLAGPTGHQWVFSGQPGTRRYVVYLQWQPERIDGAERVFTFPDTTAKRWRRATIRRVQTPLMLPFDLSHDNQQFYAVVPERLALDAPVHLDAVAPSANPSSPQ